MHFLQENMELQLTFNQNKKYNYYSIIMGYGLMMNGVGLKLKN